MLWATPERVQEYKVHSNQVLQAWGTVVKKDCLKAWETAFLCNQESPWKKQGLAAFKDIWGELPSFPSFPASQPNCFAVLRAEQSSWTARLGSVRACLSLTAHSEAHGKLKTPPIHALTHSLSQDTTPLPCYMLSSRTMEFELQIHQLFLFLIPSKDHLFLCKSVFPIIKCNVKDMQWAGFKFKAVYILTTQSVWQADTLQH